MDVVVTAVVVFVLPIAQELALAVVVSFVLSVFAVCHVLCKDSTAAHAAIAVNSALILVSFAFAIHAVTDLAEALAQCAV